MYLLPTPQSITYFKNNFFFSYDSSISIVGTYDSVIYRSIVDLKEHIKKFTGFELEIRRNTTYEKESFLVVLEEGMDDQEYCIQIQETYVKICASSVSGILYAVQTLKQIIEQCGACLPCMCIKDYPDMMTRGYYYDVTRGRVPTIAYLKKWIDLLAKYKYNQFQLYIEHTFLFKEFSEVWRDDTPLTASDILELDEYCADRGIDMVPSISTFGHLYKVLRTKSYRHLCEMEELCDEPFGLVDRMEHHTLDVTNEDSFLLIKKLIDEYLPLFRSDKFNICADETFDLGKGKSKKHAEQIGLDNMYIEHVKKLCDYVIQKGKTPMFWGDIIYKFPEKIKELPPETICMNWGYDADVTEDSTRVLSEAGARLYNCPGVSGWSQFVNRIGVSYENIKRMCIYADKYHVEGILNTDWGDFGHINHPDMGIVGMIYGASFSWNKNIPDIDVINRQISKVEFHDNTEEAVNLILDLSELCVFRWFDLVYLKENRTVEWDRITEEKLRNAVLDFEEQKNKLLVHIAKMDTEQKAMFIPYIIAIDGMLLLQEAGIQIIHMREKTTNYDSNKNKELAGKIEKWFYHYKCEWRRVSQESELFRIQEVFFWLTDLLRNECVTR